MFTALTPLLVLLHFTAVAQEPIRVTGLKEGESFIELAPTIEDAVEFGPFNQAYTYSSGRVVDAITGNPVVGAVVETWTEELNGEAGGLQRMGEAMSGEDGRFTVIRNEKARIHAPGYLIFNDAGVELFSEDIALFPDQGKVPRIKVIDTQGCPIFNAVITSTLTCSHDVPAFEVRTNSEGIALLRGYGPQENMPELRLRAQGFAGTEYIDAEHALLNGYEFTIVMPRLERQLQVKLLKEDGSPYSSGTYHIHDGECYHVGRTSEHGLVYAPYRYLADGVIIEQLGDANKPFGDLDLIPNRLVTLRQISWNRPEGLPLANIQINLPDLDDWDGKLPAAQLVHEDGWTQSISKKHWGMESFPFPAGNAALHIGGGFRQFEEEWLEFESVEGETIELMPQWEPQTKVELIWPQDARSAWIEADGHTASVDPTDQFFHYPKGARLVIHYWVDRIPYYREAIAPEGVVTIAELKDLNLIQPDLKGEEQKTNEISIYLPQDFKGPSRWQENSMLYWSEYPEVEETDQPNHFTLTVAECSPVVVRWSSAGYLPSYFVIQPGQTEPVHLQPKKLAKVLVESDVELEFPGLHEKGDLNELPPGLTHLVMQTEDGRRFGVRLNLESGEQRKITVLTQE